MAYMDAINAIEADENLDAAFAALLNLATAGYVHAMNYVANCYAAGVAVAPDRPQALRWWKKGAAAGNTACMVNIATEYRDKVGNLRRAKWWLNRAVKAGDAGANIELAETYFKIGKLKHRRKICELLSLALASGDFLSEAEQDRVADIGRELGLPEGVRRGHGQDAGRIEGLPAAISKLC